VGLANGIAGAAFLMRLIMPWATQHSRTGFLKPTPGGNPDGNFQAILAVPLFHPSEQKGPRPSPWGTIGVVRIGSSSLKCAVPRLLNRVLSCEDKEMMKLLSG